VTAPAPDARRQPPWADIVLSALVLASVAWIIDRFVVASYLPQPFIYNPDGTFMDWFDPAYWANNRGAFDNWRTVYPPLSFVFLRLFSFKECYIYDAHHGRDCDWLGQVVIIGWYLAASILSYLTYRAADRRTALWRGLATALGLPLLYGLERGNLIVPCFVFFVLGYSRLLRAAWLKWLCVAMTINFKPYMVLAALPLAVRARWRWLEGAGIVTVALYLVTLALEGAGTPQELVSNSRNWIQFVGPQYWWSLYYSTSYSALAEALKHTELMSMIGSRPVELGIVFIPMLIRLGQAGVAIALASVFFQRLNVPLHRLSALALAVLMTTTNPNGYAFVFVIYLVFLEPWRGASRIALLCAYALSISADLVLVPIYTTEFSSWLGHREVVTDFGVAVGQLVRPGLLLIIQYALTASVLGDAFRDLRRRIQSTQQPQPAPA
jgi:hypothetical protein